MNENRDLFFRNFTNLLGDFLREPKKFKHEINTFREAMIRILENKKKKRAEKFTSDAPTAILSESKFDWDSLNENETMFLEMLGMGEGLFSDANTSGGVQALFLYMFERLALTKEEMKDESCVYRMVKTFLNETDGLFLANTEEAARVQDWFFAGPIRPLNIMGPIMALIWGSRRTASRGKPDAEVPKWYVQWVKDMNLSRNIFSEPPLSIGSGGSPTTTQVAQFFWNTRFFPVVERRRAEDDISIRITDAQINPATIAVWRVSRVISKLEDEKTRDAAVKKKIQQILVVMNRMDKELVGLVEFKNNFAKFAWRFMAGENMNDSFINFVFEGPPGTGKTAAVRLVAELFHALGIVGRQEAVELRREDIIAGYEGQTAQQARMALIDRGFNSVVFFDEADTLVTDPQRDNSGREGVEAIFRFITDFSGGESVVIIAGYKEALDRTFFAVNRGLMRRFPTRVQFRGYDETEIATIMGGVLRRMRDQEDFTINEDAFNAFAKWIVANEPEPIKENTIYLQKLVDQYKFFGSFAADAQAFARSAYGAMLVSMFDQLIAEPEEAPEPRKTRMRGTQKPQKPTKPVASRVLTDSDVDAGGLEHYERKEIAFQSFVQSQAVAGNPTFAGQAPDSDKKFEFIFLSKKPANGEDKEKMKAVKNAMKDAFIREIRGSSEPEDATTFDRPMCDPEFLEQYQKAVADFKVASEKSGLLKSPEAPGKKASMRSGIDEHDLQRVFHQFYKDKPEEVEKFFQTELPRIDKFTHKNSSGQSKTFERVKNSLKNFLPSGTAVRKIDTIEGMSIGTKIVRNLFILKAVRSLYKLMEEQKGEGNVKPIEAAVETYNFLKWLPTEELFQNNRWVEDEGKVFAEEFFDAAEKLNFEKQSEVLRRMVQDVELQNDGEEDDDDDDDEEE